MERRTIAGLFLGGMMLLAATPVFADDAAAPDVEIKVFVDGQAVKFEAPPILEDGTTLVPFRAIFEKVGLTVGFDGTTQTVTGNTNNLNVELKIGSKQAKVNGQTRELSLPPRIVGQGTTLVPLRFVGEASGKDVNWDGYTRTISIAKPEDNIKQVIQNYYKYTETEDLKGVMSTLDPSRPGIEANAQYLRQVFAVYDMKYNVTEIQIKEIKGDTAIVQNTGTVHKVSGPELKDNQTSQVTILKKSNGSWLLVDSKPLTKDYLLANKFKDEKPSVSDEVKKAALDVLDKNRQYTENKDFESLKKQYAQEYANLDQMLTEAKLVSASYDIKVDSVEFSIIQATADKILIKYSGVVTVSGQGPAIPKSKSTSVMTLKKQTDGSWKIAADDTLLVEYLP